MKVLGYGWIKSGDTLKKALEQYGVKDGVIQEGKGKELLASIGDVRKDVQKSLEEKEMRKSAKPRYFRLILEEVES
jgi:hypothetical protein